MQTINMHEAKTHLSRLTEEVARYGEPFIIAKAGKPLVQVIPYTEHRQPSKRIGCLPPMNIPDDFNQMDNAEIETLFAGADDEILA